MTDEMAFMLLGFLSLMCGIWNFDNYKCYLFFALALFIFIMDMFVINTGEKTNEQRRKAKEITKKLRGENGIQSKKH